MKKALAMPCDREGWYHYYAKVHDKTGTFDSAHLAMWLYLLMIAEI